MLQPVGPLPPQVYWRRRLVLLGAIVLLMMLGLAMCSGGSGPRQAAGGAALTATPTPTGGPSAATITPSPGSAGGPAPGTVPATGPSPSASPSTSPVATTPASTGPPGPCPDAALTVQAGTARPAYQVGQTPVLKLSVRNTGVEPCVRDVGPRQQGMLLYDGTTRIWSSNDCYPDGGTDVRTLAPGEVVSATVVWSGLSSQPGCAGARTRVQAGSYRLIASVGTAKSKPATLVLQ